MKQGWEVKKLGEVCDIICGQDYKSVKDDNGKYPIYGTGGIMGYASQYRCPANSVIIGRKGSINNPLFVETEFWNVDTAFGVVPNETILHPKFFYLFCKDYDFTRHDVSVTIPSLRRTDILKINVPIPPIAEQENIVAELDCLSGIIEKKKQQLKELDNLAQSIFYEMFGDPVENDKGWETKKVIDVVKLQRGYDLPIQHRQSDGGIPVWGSNGIVGWHNEAKVDYGVITGRSGTLGTVYSYDKPFFPLNTTLFSVDTHGNDIVYLKYLLNIFDLKRFGTGTGVPTLNRNVFHSEPIISVPLTLQQDFASKIESIEKQKELIAKSIKETETLFNSRMDYYFN